jgi:acyl-CoA synthetase (AMP-forming)/AMP-acid ligase II
MVTALFGTLAAGACSVPLNTSVSDEAIVAMLRDAGIRALVVSGEHRERFERLLPGFPPSCCACAMPRPTAGRRLAT